MNTPEEIIYQTLAVDSGIASIVDDRISPMKSIDDGELPCITYQIVGASVEYTQDGPEIMQDPDVHIDLWADMGSYEVLTELRVAVLNCLYGADSPSIARYFFVKDDGTDILEPKPRMLRKRIRATLWHRHEA